MNEKIYTDEQISKIKKQWLRVWMATCGFSFLTFSIVLIMFIYPASQNSVKALGFIMFIYLGIAIAGLLFGFLPLYYCAYKKPGTRLIGSCILLGLVFIICSFCMFCIELVTTLQNDNFRNAYIFGLYFLQLFLQGYILLVFYRLYQVNSFLQKQKINNDDVIENIK